MSGKCPVSGILLIPPNRPAKLVMGLTGAMNNDERGGAEGAHGTLILIEGVGCVILLFIPPNQLNRVCMCHLIFHVHVSS